MQEKMDDSMEQYKQKTTLNSPDFVVEFLQLYKSLPAVWKLRSKEYGDRTEKSAAYRKLIEKLREVDPLANRESVVRKINNLRTSYRRELKKVQKSRKSVRNPAFVYKPSLWYYPYMSFIEEQESLRLWNKPSASYSDDNEDTIPLFDMPHEETTPDPPLAQPASHIKTEAEDILEPQLNFDNLSESTCSFDYRVQIAQQECGSESMRIQNTCSSPNIVSCSICSERYECACWTKEKKDKTTECNTQASNKQAEDEFVVIGKTYAYKLRNLKHDQRIFAEKLISDVLFEAQLGGLSRHSILVVKPEDPLLN